MDSNKIQKEDYEQANMQEQEHDQEQEIENENEKARLSGINIIEYYDVNPKGKRSSSFCFKVTIVSLFTACILGLFFFISLKMVEIVYDDKSKENKINISLNQNKDNITSPDIQQIKTATTNTVKKTVYGIQYGPELVGNPTGVASYRQGVIPQTAKLTTAIGNDVPTTLANVTVGNLAATGSSDNAVSAAYGTKPTATVKANTANIAVLDRDKLVTPGSTGSCDASDSDHPCGYVSTGGHTNTSTDRVWLKVALAADAQ